MLQHEGDWIQRAGLDPAVIPMALSESTRYLHAPWRASGKLRASEGIEWECNTDIKRINRLHTCCSHLVDLVLFSALGSGAGRDLWIFSMLCISPCYTPVTVSCLPEASLGQTHASSTLLHRREPFWANSATISPPCNLWPRLVWLEECTISYLLCVPEKWCRDGTENTGKKYISLPFFNHRITE